MCKVIPSAINLLFAAFLLVATSAVAQPVITAFSPASGPVGTTVTIMGSGFNASPAANIVYFGAVKAPVTGGSANSLTVTAPAGATYQPVSVLNTVTGLAGFSNRPFQVTVPNSSSIQPGFFKQTVTVPTQAAEFSRAADFDGDGRPDLVTSGFGSYMVSVHRNVSDSGSLTASSFAAAQVFAAGTSSLFSMAIVDVDGDGRLDLVLPSLVLQEIAILRNTSNPGSISFATPVKFSPDGSPLIVDFSDMDRDGKPDLVMGDYHGVSVLRNLSTPGNITPASFGPRVTLAGLGGNGGPYIALGDMDGDGACDVVITSSDDNTVAVLRNLSTPGNLTAATFAAPVKFPTNGAPFNTLVGDIDGDNRPDVVVVSRHARLSNDYERDTVSVYRNTSSTGSIILSARVDFALDTLAVDATMGNVDGDGKPDLVITERDKKILAVLRNTAVPGSISTTSFASPVSFLTPGNSSSSAAICDLDRDGFAEVIVSFSAPGTFTIFKSGASAPVKSKPVITSFVPSSGPAGTILTIAGTNFNAIPGSNTVYFGAVKAAVVAASPTSLTVTVPAGATYKPVSVLDNTTGLIGYSANPFRLTFNNPLGTGIPQGFYQPKVDFYFSAPGTPNRMVLSDIDGDGKPDMVAASYGTIVVYRNTSVAGSATILETSFAAGVEVSRSNSFINSLDVGDLDGDGKPDIMVTDVGLNRVYVFRNTSSPGSITAASFAPAVEFGTGVLRSAVIGDVDGNGKPDIVAADQGSGNMVVFFNNTVPGTITPSSFTERGDYRVGTPTQGPAFFALNDVDGDSRPDLVVANYNSTTISVFRNLTTESNPLVSFAPAVDIPVGGISGYFIMADMDGDGKADIIRGVYPGSGISVLRNTATPGIIDASSFAAGVLVSNINTNVFVAGDADGDGKPDIIASNNNSPSFSVIRNRSAPGGFTDSSFAPKVDFPLEGTLLTAVLGDVDGDGMAELIASNDYRSTLSVFKIVTALPPSISSFNPASGPVGTAVTIAGNNFHPTPSGNTVYFGAVKAAVVAASPTSLTVTVPAGATYQPISVLNNANGLTAYSAKPFTVTFNNPSSTGIPAGFYLPRTDYGTGALPYAVAVGDLDGDGKTDLVSINANAHTVSVLRNTTAGGPGSAPSFASKIDFTTGTDPRAVMISDLDGDGKPDILVLNSLAGSVSVLRNTSSAGSITASSFASKIDFALGAAVTYPYSVGVGDLDADGRPEIVAANLITNSLSILRNGALPGSITPSSFKLLPTVNVSIYPRFIVISDLDGDGLADLAVANERSNTVSVLRNTTLQGKDISFDYALDFTLGANPPCLAAGDVDGDGKPDLVAANYSANTLSVLRNTATPGSINSFSFAAKVDFATGINPFCVAMGDADGDGKPDLVTANAGSNTISVLRNTATPGTVSAASFAAKVDFAASGYPMFVAMGDLNGDGIPEIAAANGATNTISVYRVNTTAPAAGAPATVPPGITLLVYPNPSAGELLLQLANMQAPAVTVEVFGDGGRRLEKKQIEVAENSAQTTLQLNLRSQPAGIYYIKATGINGIQVVKVVVQR